MIENIYKLSEEIDACINQHSKKNEPDIIKEITEKIKLSKNNNFTLSDNSTKVMVSGDFLHGHKSQCKFRYEPENKIRQKELCDLMVVSVIAEKKKILSIKASFIQAKKGEKKISFLQN